MLRGEIGVAMVAAAKLVVLEQGNEPEYVPQRHHVVAKIVKELRRNPSLAT